VVVFSGTASAMRSSSQLLGIESLRLAQMMPPDRLAPRSVRSSMTMVWGFSDSARFNSSLVMSVMPVLSAASRASAVAFALGSASLAALYPLAMAGAGQ
jgi:hypothetical protein